MVKPQKLNLGKPKAKVEAGADVYNAGYAVNKAYFKHYSDCQYYKCWRIILEKKKLITAQDRVLDLGCGPGQFAEYVKDIGTKSYTGVDFSSVAVEQATKRLAESNFNFICGDLYVCDLPNEVDVIISLEVFEHLAKDRKVMKRLKKLFPGTRFVFSVPNFDHRNHIRFFRNKKSIISRFSAFCDIEKIIKVPLSKKKCLWVFYGHLGQPKKKQVEQTEQGESNQENSIAS